MHERILSRKKPSMWIFLKWQLQNFYSLFPRIWIHRTYRSRNRNVCILVASPRPFHSNILPPILASLESLWSCSRARRNCPCIFGNPSRTVSRVLFSGLRRWQHKKMRRGWKWGAILGEAWLPRYWKARNRACFEDAFGRSIKAHDAIKLCAFQFYWSVIRFQVQFFKQRTQILSKYFL